MKFLTELDYKMQWFFSNKQIKDTLRVPPLLGKFYLVIVSVGAPLRRICFILIKVEQKKVLRPPSWPYRLSVIWFYWKILLNFSWIWGISHCLLPHPGSVLGQLIRWVYSPAFLHLPFPLLSSLWNHLPTPNGVGFVCSREGIIERVPSQIYMTL